MSKESFRRAAGVLVFAMAPCQRQPRSLSALSAKVRLELGEGLPEAEECAICFEPGNFVDLPCSCDSMALDFKG